MFKKLYFLLCIICITFAQASAKDLDAPIEITSDKVEYFRDIGKITFGKNVYATQKNLQLWCDNMDVILTNTKDGTSSDIQKILLHNHVKIIKEQDEITAKHAQYDVKTETITFLDDVNLKQNDNILHGQKLIYRVKTGESLLSTSNNNSSEKVKAIISPNNIDK